MASLQASHRGMPLELSERDTDNRTFFEHCSRGDFRLQGCCGCGLLRYPPGPSCPWCACVDSTWLPVPGLGTIYSYMEVHQASQPAFRDAVPYVVVLVELHTQRDQPAPHQSLRVVGNLVHQDGRLASADEASFGIGAAVRMTFLPVAPGLALPQWVLCTPAPDSGRVWRYPGSHRVNPGRPGDAGRSL